MPLKPLKTTVASAWGAKPAPTVEEQPGGEPPMLLLPAHLAIDPESLTAVCAQVQAAVAAAVRAGVAEGFAAAWPEDQPAPTAPPAAG